MNRNFMSIAVVTIARHTSAFDGAQYATTKHMIINSILDELRFQMRHIGVDHGTPNPNAPKSVTDCVYALNRQLITGDDYTVKRALRDCYFAALRALRDVSAELEAM